MRWFESRSAKGKTLLIREERKVLPAGDYALKGFEDRCIIERKGSLKELAQNLLSDDWGRAHKAFQKLQDATEHPYLMLECTLADLQTKSRWVQEPERVVDALMALVEKFGFHLWLCGTVKDIKQKRRAGELMLRLMLAHAYQQEVNYECDTTISKLTSQLEQRGTTPKGKGPPA